MNPEIELQEYFFQEVKENQMSKRKINVNMMIEDVSSKIETYLENVIHGKDTDINFQLNKYQLQDYYRELMRIRNHSLKHIIEEGSLSSGSYMDFGVGHGLNLRKETNVIEKLKFDNIFLYDIQNNLLTDEIGRNAIKYCNGSAYATNLNGERLHIQFSTVLPDMGFDIVNMSFVAGLDIDLIEEASSYVGTQKENAGFLVVSDYNMKSASDLEVIELCRSFEEQRIIYNSGVEALIDRTTRYSIDDYAHKIEETGLELYKKVSVNEKFGVVIGVKR